MVHHKLAIILNPMSAGGRTRRLQKTILQAIHNSITTGYDLKITRAPNDGTILTKEAIQNGSELIIAVGGDGTIQEVVNGMFAKNSNKNCRLGIISSGTGHGFAQSLGLPTSLRGQLDVALNGRMRKVDIGKVTFRNQEGIGDTRYFVNECQLGIGGAVVQRVQRSYKRLGGKLGFGLGTIVTVLRHPNQFITYTIDESNSISTMQTGITVANGAFTGGGMNLAPAASVDDGWLNLLIMQEMSVAERLGSFPKIYSGKHIHLKKFNYQTIHSISINSSEKVLVEADGELLGTTPCRVEIVPASLNVQAS